MPHRLLIYFLLLYIIFYRLPRFIPTPPLTNRRCNQMRTGDLLLYSGRSLDSALIRAWTAGTFTHIGMVWLDDRQQRYCWNSDKQSTTPCILSGRCREGPQLQLLDDKIAGGSGGCMYHVPWNDRYQRPQLTRDYMQRFAAAGFRDSVVVMATTAMPEWVPNVATDECNSWLCTELVAKTIFELTGYYVARRTRPDSFLALPLVRRDLISLV